MKFLHNLTQIGLKHFDGPLWLGIIWNLVILVFAVMEWHLLKRVKEQFKVKDRGKSRDITSIDRSLNLQSVAYIFKSIPPQNFLNG